MDASVVLDYGLTFTGTADTGFKVPLSADPSAGSDGQGFRPMELMLVSLAGCTAMDVLSIMNKMRQQVTGFEVKVHADRAKEHPKVFTEIVIEYIVRGRQINPHNLEQAIELSAVRYCPAQAMLAKGAHIRHTHRIIEDGVEAVSGQA